MSEHTPGPWHLRLEPFADGTPYAIIDSGADIHPIAGGAYNEETQQGFRICGIFGEADARLIAASPNMLAALYNVAARLEDDLAASKGGEVKGVTEDHRYQMGQHLAEVRAVIAMATGATR